MTKLKKPYPALGPIGREFNECLETVLDARETRPGREEVMTWHQWFAAGAGSALKALVDRATDTENPVQSDFVKTLLDEVRTMNETMRQIEEGRGQTWH